MLFLLLSLWELKTNYMRTLSFSSSESISSLKSLCNYSFLQGLCLTGYLNIKRKIKVIVIWLRIVSIDEKFQKRKSYCWILEHLIDPVSSDSFHLILIVINTNSNTNEAILCRRILFCICHHVYYGDIRKRRSIHCLFVCLFFWHLYNYIV